MGRTEELRYIYQTRKNQMDLKMLHEFIDLLLIDNDRLIETMEDISAQQDRDLDKEKNDYRDDMY